MLFFEREQQYFFAAGELGMQNMRHIDVEMHMGYTGGAAHKKHGVFFNKPLHQVIGPGKILR